MEKIMVNVTAKDIFNAQAGKGFKEAGASKKTGRLTGFAVYEVENMNTETGEVTDKTISLMKVDNELYSGESKVVSDRLKQLHDFVSDEEIANGIEIMFSEIKVGRGMATTFLMK